MSLWPARVDDRLVDDVQLLVFDRLAQRAFQQFAIRQVGIHRRVIDTGAVAALVLGAIERHVRVTQDVAGVLDAAIDHRDPDRCADIDAVAADNKWRADCR